MVLIITKSEIISNTNKRETFICIQNKCKDIIQNKQQSLNIINTTSKINDIKQWNI